ncbi:MAG TPA: FAD-dependent oxidoreductase [Alcaligenes sp.]|nr:FAD-dependent oxidoreductase [Alcaligenes sp.]HRL26101.1 FAD-dependent oxidoreductase [Alcaligenes sp.]
MSTVLILGAGQAGGWAARTLRDQGFAGRIVLVGQESHAPYERPPLSKDILQGQGTSVAELTLLDAATMQALNIEALLGRCALRIDRERKTVTLDDGSELAYDHLVLATGGRARQLLPELAQHPRMFTLRTLDDALRLKESLSQPSHLLIIGGGWIGLEVAATARQLGHEVTVLEAAPRLCQRSVCAAMSDELATVHTEQGVDLRLGTTAAQVQPEAAGFVATLSDGSTLTCTHIVMAAGLLANDELAEQAGLPCRQGVIVDEQCRSADPHIYAAGDVALRPADGVRPALRLESWQNAQDQGMAVAQAILGQQVHYLPTPLVWSQQYDRFIQICGHVDQAQDTVLRSVKQGGSLRFYLDAQGALQGVVGINAGRDWRAARALVERREKADPRALADPAIALNKLPQALA